MNKHFPQLWAADEPSIDTDEIIVDSFAGGGGASTGIELALGRSPDFAINHDPEALALHAANHPQTVHLANNIYKVDPDDVGRGRPVGLLWASPDCKHFSKAKGGTPVKREIRDLAWVVVMWAERRRPRVIILENVEEFQTWGPLIETAKGLMPDPERKGETFNQWIAALKKLGYKVEWKELRACDYGAPTTRKRLFLIARCDGKKIAWPEPTHGSPTDADVIAGRKLPWVTAAEIIDWSEPCPSIFDTSEEIMEKFGVRAVRPLAENTLARIHKGIDRYVIKAAKPFVVRTDHSSAKTAGVHDIDAPTRTVTGAGGLAVVAPHLTKFRNGAVGSALDEPTPTVTANSFIQRPGGAAPLGIVAAHLSAAQHGGSHRSADEPHRTIAASDKDQNQVVAAHLMTMRNAGKPFNDADKPTHTVTAGGAGLSLVAASMVQTGYGEREGQEPRALDPGAPLGTVVAGGVKHAAVAAFLAQHNNDQKPSGGSYPKPGRPVTDPLSTVTATGSQQAVISAGLMNMKGEDRATWPIDGGTPTQTAGGTHIAEVRAFLLKYYGNEEDGHRLDKPAGTVTTRDRFGLVTIEGEEYQITDIGMRMLTPRELFRAQGFPAGYQIEVGRGPDGQSVALTKTAQVRMCGNSVCPPIAAALVAANCSDLALTPRMAAE
jgi:DNA (cytosine-5)-methyltransferase 1